MAFTVKLPGEIGLDVVGKRDLRLSESSWYTCCGTWWTSTVCPSCGLRPFQSGTDPVDDVRPGFEDLGDPLRPGSVVKS